MAAKKKPKSKAQKERERIEKENLISTAKRQRAIDLFNEGWKQARIAEEVSVTPATVARWLRGAGIAARPKAEPATEDEIFERNLDEAASETIADAKLAARDEEQQSLLEVAENQSSPADKYQAYVAASAIRMLRDNLMNVRGPRTIRELSELDQLIRRNLGLNPKGGTAGSGTLSIDISILNNTKADLGTSALKTGVVIDVEPDED